MERFRDLKQKKGRKGKKNKIEEVWAEKSIKW